MKKIIILLILLFSMEYTFSQENNDELVHAIIPLDLKFVHLKKDSCTENELLRAIVEKLKMKGLVFNLITDDWYFDDSYLFSVFNSSYKTDIFNKIYCYRKIYYTDSIYNPIDHWIQIKEWIFFNEKEAIIACNFINNGEFNSDYFGPRSWVCTRKGKVVFFICGASADFWSIKGLSLKYEIEDIINQR